MQEILYATWIFFVLGFVIMYAARWWAARQPQPSPAPLRAAPDADPVMTSLEKIVLGLICVVGLVWFLSFQSSGSSEGVPSAARQALEIGAVDPWFSSSRVQGKSFNSELNLATWSVFAGYCGLFAGAALLRRVTKATISVWIAIGIFMLAVVSISTITRYASRLTNSPAPVGSR
jgi:hypothetical protein